jgi:hypothetical protein
VVDVVGVDEQLQVVCEATECHLFAVIGDDTVPRRCFAGCASLSGESLYVARGTHYRPRGSTWHAWIPEKLLVWPLLLQPYSCMRTSTMMRTDIVLANGSHQVQPP